MAWHGMMRYARHNFRQHTVLTLEDDEDIAGKRKHLKMLISHQQRREMINEEMRCSPAASVNKLLKARLLSEACQCQRLVIIGKVFGIFFPCLRFAVVVVRLHNK